MKWRRVLCWCVLVFPVLAAAVEARADETNGPESPQATCGVPSQRPTIQAAVNDPICTTIQVQAGVFPEVVRINRNLTLVGAGTDLTMITGQVEVAGTGVVVLISDLAVDTSVPGSAGCFGDAMQVGKGAEALVRFAFEASTRRVRGPCLLTLLFADGFETGNTTSRWSGTVGGP